MGASPGINRGSSPKCKVAGQKCKVELKVQSVKWKSNAESDTRTVETDSEELKMGVDFRYHEANLAEMIPEVNGRTWK